jgi:hypothetical protein
MELNYSFQNISKLLLEYFDNNKIYMPFSIPYILHFIDLLIYEIIDLKNTNSNEFKLINIFNKNHIINKYKEYYNLNLIGKDLYILVHLSYKYLNNTLITILINNIKLLLDIHNELNIIISLNIENNFILKRFFIFNNIHNVNDILSDLLVTKLISIYKFFDIEEINFEKYYNIKQISSGGSAFSIYKGIELDSKKDTLEPPSSTPIPTLLRP